MFWIKLLTTFLIVLSLCMSFINYQELATRLKEINLDILDPSYRRTKNKIGQYQILAIGCCVIFSMGVTLLIWLWS